MNITNENGIAGIVHRIPLALFLSYVMACAAYFSGKSWVKTIVYVFSVALLATDTFLHNPKSVIRISLCRTAKRNPLIFPI